MALEAATRPTTTGARGVETDDVVVSFTHVSLAFDVPIPFSPPMENYVIPDVEKVVSATREVLSATPVS